jgi:hypothetical protein
MLGRRKRSALGRPRALAPAARCRGWGNTPDSGLDGDENGSVMTPLTSPRGEGTGGRREAAAAKLFWGQIAR